MRVRQPGTDVAPRTTGETGIGAAWPLGGREAPGEAKREVIESGWSWFVAGSLGKMSGCGGALGRVRCLVARAEEEVSERVRGLFEGGEIWSVFGSPRLFFGAKRRRRPGRYRDMCGLFTIEIVAWGILERPFAGRRYPRAALPRGSRTPSQDRASGPKTVRRTYVEAATGETQGLPNERSSAASVSESAAAPG